MPELHKSCPEFLRHKNTLIHPKVLQKAGIKMRKIVHNEGEFIVIRDSAYHSGFNAGFNIAEAVNFALPHWIKETAPFVSFCLCRKDNVTINIDQFLKNLKNKRKRMAEPVEQKKRGRPRKEQETASKRKRDQKFSRKMFSL